MPFCAEILSIYRASIASQSNGIEAIAARVSFFDDKWAEEWRNDPKNMNESEQVEFLTTVKELLLHENKSVIFDDLDISSYEMMASHLLLSVKVNLFRSRGDISNLKDLKWAELITFFELRSLSKRGNLVILSNLRRGLKRFFEGRGGNHNAKYQELMEEIKLAHQALGR